MPNDWDTPPTAEEMGGTAKADPWASPPTPEERTSVFGIQKDPTNPQMKARADAAMNRDIGSLMGSKSQIRQGVLADALSPEPSNLGGESVQLLQDYIAQRKQQQTGKPEGAPMMATTGDHKEMPGALRAFMETGGRVLGAGANFLSDVAGTRSGQPRDPIADAKLNNEFVRSMGRAIFDTSKPVITKAMPEIVEKHGQEAVPESEVGGTLKNAIRAGGTALSKALEGAMFVGKLAAAQSPVQRGVMLATSKPSIMDQAPQDAPGGKTIAGPFGMRVGPNEAAEAGTALWMLEDPMAKTLGPAASLAGKAGSAVAKIPAVQKAGNAAFTKAAPVLDPLGKLFIGTPYEAKMAVREASPAVATVPGQAQDLSRSVTSVPYKQNIELAKVAEAVEKAKKVTPQHQDFFFGAIESSDPAARNFYLGMLNHDELAAVDAYEALASQHGGIAQATRGQQLRDFYAAHPLTKDAKEFSAQAPRSLPPSVPVDSVPRPGGFSKERTLPEALSAEAGKPIESLPEVNDYVKHQVALSQKGQATSPIVAGYGPGDQSLMYKYGLKPGENLQEANPAKNIAMRFVPSAQENVWAQTIKNDIGKLAVDIGPNGEIPSGFAVPAQGSLASKVLPGKAIPKTANEWLEKASASGDKTWLEKIPSAAGSAWKGAVTAVAGPGYHLRNEMYSLGKNASEFGLKTPGLEKAAFDIASGAPGAVNGVSYDAIRKAAAEAGTFAGTGAAPGKSINQIKVSAGLKTDNFPTFRKIPEAAGKLATGVDEHNRMVAILGRLEQNGGNLTEAIDWAKQHIVMTGEASPFLEKASNVMPFIKWTGKETPNAAKFLASGKGTFPVKVQNLAEQLNGQPVADRFQDRRMREQAGFPTGYSNDIGQPFYMPQPWSVGVPLAQTLDPVYRAAAGESGAQVAKSALSTAAANMWPPIAWGIAGLTGERPNTKTPLSRLQKAAPWQEAVATALPEVAPMVGVQKGEDGTMYTTGAEAMIASSVPWAQIVRIPMAPTQLERVRSAMVMAGVPLSALDPTYRQQEMGSALNEKIKDSLSRSKKLKGMPVLPHR